MFIIHGLKRPLQRLVMASLGLLLIACTSVQPLHRAHDSNLPKNVGIHGYSPVSYFEKNTAEPGDPQYQASHKGRVYYFASEQQRATFLSMPDKYEPRYGEYCPYSLALGRRVGIDPTNFKIHDGELLLFHSAIELSTVNVPEQYELFEKADKEFTLLEF